MIEWMQHHKKWLVITIWVSAISFIAAGMFNWGSYSFSLNGDAVAKVGTIDITRPQFDYEYQRIYNIYNDAYNNTLDEGQAKQLGIKKIAFELLEQKALQLNYARDLNITATKEEILNTIYEIDSFKKDSKFDANLYKDILKRQGMKPQTFEKMVEESIILQKVGSLMPVKTSDLELESVSTNLNLLDSVEIFDFKPNKTIKEASEQEIKKYWENHKAKYISNPSYTITFDVVPLGNYAVSEQEIQSQYNNNKAQYLNDNGDLLPLKDVKSQVTKDAQKNKANNDALKKYINLKKQGREGREKQTIDEDNLGVFDQKILDDIAVLDLNTAIKPILLEDKFYIIKLLSRQESAVLSFDKAKARAKIDLLAQLNEQLLQKEAEDKLKNFKGKNLGFISAISDVRISTLSNNQSKKVIQEIFTNNKKEGFVIIDNSAILYRISAQKLVPLASPEFVKNDNVINNFINFKTRYFDQAFVEDLKKKYPIKYFIDKNSLQ